MPYPLSHTPERVRKLNRCCALVFPFLLGLSTNSNAGTAAVLTLAETVQLSTRDQPQLAALQLQEEAALNAARAEGELPDPKIVMGVENLPVTGDDAFHLGREDMTMLTVGFMQDVVRRNKRDAAVASMNAQAARVAADRETSAWTIRKEAALAWLDVFEAQRRAANVRALVAQATTERQIGVEQLRSGAQAAGEVLKMQTEISNLRDQMFIAERDETRARAMLSRWIGTDALRPFPERLPHELTAQVRNDVDMQQAHPSLKSAEHSIDVATSAVDRARAERAPDWAWQVMYGYREDDRSDMITVQFTVGLPWNRADRQHRRIAEKLAEASAARAELTDRQRMLDSEFMAARADLAAAEARLQEHESGLAPASQSLVETSQAAYAGGKGTLLDVWQARRVHLEATLHHDMILTDRARALTRLAWITGQWEVLP